MLVAIGDGFGETPLGLAEPVLIAVERVHICVGSARQLLHVPVERDLQRLVHDGYPVSALVRDGPGVGVERITEHPGQPERPGQRLRPP